MSAQHKLMYAVREGRLEDVKSLINSYGLSYSKEWSDGYVLLCDAIKNKRSAVAELLLSRGCKVNSKNSSTKPCDTPLHFAVVNGDTGIVKMLLDRDARVDAKNRDGTTALHIAVENTNIEITDLLLKHRANVNAIDMYHSPLDIAVRIGCLQLVESLLKHGAHVNLENTSKWGSRYTPLHTALKYYNGSKEIITLLLKSGANVNAKGEDNKTPLHIAAQRGNVNVAEDLLNHGGFINASTLKERLAPLHIVSELGNEEAVKLFLNKGALTDACTNSNLTPLHLATKKGHLEIVKLLLQHEAKVDSQDKDGKTILHYAVENGNPIIVEEVLKYFPSLNNQCNKNCLKLAACESKKEYENIVEALQKYGFSVESTDVNDIKLICNSIERGYLKIVEDILKYGANINQLLDSKNFTLLHCAVKNNQAKVAQLLINSGSDLDAKDKSNKTPIIYAIENANPEITQLLLSNKANIKDDPELLNTAVGKNCIKIIEILLQNNVDINAADKKGRTALHFTAVDLREDFFENLFKNMLKKKSDDNIKGAIARLLLSKGANVDAETESGLTTLYAAIEKGYTKVVEALLEYNVNLDIKLKNLTPLYFAAHKGSADISSLLLKKKEIDVNAKQTDGSTALHIAADRGHKELVKVLLEHGAKVDSKMKNGWTALHYSAQKGHHEVTKIVLKFGADVNSKDESGKTALHIASQRGHLKVVTTLLKYGSDINIVNRNNNTSLDYAMAGIETYYRRLRQCSLYAGSEYESDQDDSPWEEVTKVLKNHVIKLKSANLYVSVDLQLVLDYYESSNLKKEITIMKSEKINNSNISFYDILTKGANSLAMYNNKSIVQTLNSGDYIEKFPVYASMIKRSFKKGMEKKELIKKGNDILHFFFNYILELPSDCYEKIIIYLSNNDLRNLIDASEPLFINDIKKNEVQ